PFGDLDQAFVAPIVDPIQRRSVAVVFARSITEQREASAGSRFAPDPRRRWYLCVVVFSRDLARRLTREAHQREPWSDEACESHNPASRLRERSLLHLCLTTMLVASPW